MSNAVEGGLGAGGGEGGKMRSVNFLTASLAKSAAGGGLDGGNSNAKRGKGAMSKRVGGRGGRPRGKSGKSALRYDMEIDKTCPNLSEQERKKMRRWGYMHKQGTSLVHTKHRENKACLW